MNEENQKQARPGIRRVIPFFLALGIMTAIAFCVPLRPERSMMEKRELEKFPEFSWAALVSGSYFDDITLWFSDTFPGREGWIATASWIQSLHGTSEITIQGDLPIPETIPQIPEPDMEAENIENETQEETAAETEAPEVTEETVPQETGWGGVDAGHQAEIQLGAVIQIGDTAFNYQGFNKYQSDTYAAAIREFAEKMKEQGVRVISAPAPTSVGIMVEDEYLEALKCASQDEMIRYMHSVMGDDVVTVDTYGALVPHNDEYIYFRTDHHWTALGAYYSYRAICEALSMTPAELSSFRVWDQGEFFGSLTYKAARPYQLRSDHVDAYVPQGDILHMVYDNSSFGVERPLLQDMTKREVSTKYLTFIWSDNPLSVITNRSLPDGPSCILVKDSFGNCLAPFLTQNYHRVFVVDYRKFTCVKLKTLIEEAGIDDVIFAPYVTATQSIQGVQMLSGLTK